ncbi:MAG: adenylyltransferase/cytidyltransferase family protein [Clostridia bacterium]|nr:adenylyltransferase/cytidyltransferase family protein [Clostridia bacterium]
MKALILNSGLGHRMGILTSEHPKCMTEVSPYDTILSRQLRIIASYGIQEVVMTTGYFDEILVNYCHSLNLPLKYTFVNNSMYDSTNYIYSIYCAKEYLRNEDIVFMHGDLVFENAVFEAILKSEKSCMTVSSTLPLPEKDFKAVIRDKKIDKIGVGYFNDAIAAQPLYKLNKSDWNAWLDEICRFCESDNRKCYAENAFNEVSDRCLVYPLDVKNKLCSEIDTPEDLAVVSAKVHEVENRIVYMCFSTDIIHGGHINLIRKAKKLGKLVIGALTDEAIKGYKRHPILPFEERKILYENISGVYKVIEQKTLSYKDVLEELQPDYVVHGDNWKTGVQQPIRQEVIEILAEYGGKLVEFPYSSDTKYDEIEKLTRAKDLFEKNKK